MAMVLRRVSPKPFRIMSCSYRLLSNEADDNSNERRKYEVHTKIPALEKMMTNFFRSFESRNKKRRMVGEDHLGNLYYEVVGEKSVTHGRRGYLPTRRVGELDPIPPEWDSWIRGRRKDPPTQAEIDRNMAVTSLKQQRAMQLEDEHYQSKLRLEQEESAYLTGDSKDAKTPSAEPHGVTAEKESEEMSSQKIPRFPEIKTTGGAEKSGNLKEGFFPGFKEKPHGFPMYEEYEVQPGAKSRGTDKSEEELRRQSPFRRWWKDL